MRIIAGKFRGRRLGSPDSLDTRPTSDRLRETLFNVLTPRISETRFLDLCAGSGAVGIEALSRGASHATFVDHSRQMRALIESNLALCRITDAESVVVTSDAVEFLRKAVKRGDGPWNIIFYDPPYADDHEPVLDALGEFAAGLLEHNGMLIVEHHHKTSLPERTGKLQRSRVLKQGDSSLSFYQVV
ncbi:MAG TPA: 16S rRNA (guanine(966)-N(2))-methyltransferase RsmD [Pyrinomonadaceae bacterium]|nr:16S rRNA (guanine(966)-N(2))-methyltransferase RsmD [Pyrinomonadaceae bacterium]